MHAQATEHTLGDNAGHGVREEMFQLLRDVLAGRTRIAAGDYIELIKSLNAQSAGTEPR